MSEEKHNNMTPSVSAGKDPEKEFIEDAGRPMHDMYHEYLDLCETFQGKRLKKVIRKVDSRIVFPLIMCYLLAYIDRSNVANAKLFGALPDMHMSGQQWNTALSVFFVSYAVMGPFSNMALNKVGARFWVPLLLMLVAIVQICAGVQSSYGGWVAFRFLLGVVEAGIYPGCSVILSTWYSPEEVHTRMAFFYSASSCSGAFSGLLAYGIGGGLDHTWGYRGWRFIYIIEALFTFCMGLIAFFIVIDHPDNAGRWLSDEERRFLSLRSQFSRGKGTGVSEDSSFSWSAVWEACKSPHVWILSVTHLLLVTPVYGLSFSLPTMINNLGFSAARAQAMTTPPYVFACILTVVSGILADRYQKRMPVIALASVMSLAGFIIIMITVRYPHLTGVTLFGIFLAAGGLYPVSPTVTAWISQNQAGASKRAVSIGIVFMGSCLSGLIGSNIYLPDEDPTFPTGFGISIAFIAVGGWVLPILYWLWLKRLNARNAEIPEDEIRARYSDAQLIEMGDKSPLFRFQT